MNYREKFKNGNTATKLIYINIVVFLLITIFEVFIKLFKITDFNVAEFLQLPSGFKPFATQFWSIITYMFLHINFWHLFFNMLCLYWFGQIFLQNFTNKQLIGLYLIGGIAGGILYMLSFNYIPYFEGKDALLCGASASIMAIIVATALDMPNMPLRLLFIGEIKLKWVAVAVVLISVTGITSKNAGGEIAHIGGALAGWIWFVLLKRKFDLTKPLDKLISFFVKIYNKIFNRKTIKLRVSNRNYHYVKSDEQYNVERKQNNDKLDKILDKIRQSGYTSLTEQEKKELFEVSKKI